MEADSEFVWIASSSGISRLNQRSKRENPIGFEKMFNHVYIFDIELVNNQLWIASNYELTIVWSGAISVIFMLVMSLTKYKELVTAVTFPVLFAIFLVLTMKLSVLTSLGEVELLWYFIPLFCLVLIYYYIEEAINKSVQRYNLARWKIIGMCGFQGISCFGAFVSKLQ